MKEIQVQVKERILNLINADKMVLPTLPEVALKVRETAADPYVDIPKLTKVIAEDAALSARMVQLANSPLMRTANKIEDLTTAVMRLGVDRTANLATSIAMKQMFQATSDTVDAHMRENWALSTEVAGRCHVLSRNFSNLQADQASLAGLTHRIGVLPILTFAEDHDDLLTNKETLDAVIEAIHPQIGAKILDAWDFADHLKLVPNDSQKGDRDIEQPDYADLVFVANQQINGITENIECASFQRLGIGTAANDDELQEEVNAVTQLFN